MPDPVMLQTGRHLPKTARHTLRAALCVLSGLALPSMAADIAARAAQAAPAACRGTIYLTFDTGSQSQAELIADTLEKHHVKATFFLANEKTVNKDYALDPAWAPLWKRLVADGHAFGSHTFDHVYWQRDLPDGRFIFKPQFGAQAGRQVTWDGAQYCAEINRVAGRFKQLTGADMDHFWRAPGGKTSPALLAAGTHCGYVHAPWSPAGFSGDELPSAQWPNALLLRRALDTLQDGDIFLAHMGIWSRRDAWAPAVLAPLIEGLERKGFCFATLRDHPAYRAYAVPALLSTETRAEP